MGDQPATVPELRALRGRGPFRRCFKSNFKRIRKMVRAKGARKQKGPDFVFPFSRSPLSSSSETTRASVHIGRNIFQWIHTEQSIKTMKTTRMSKYVETLEPDEADKKKKEKKNMATLLSESLTVVELPSKMIQALDSQRDAKRSPEFAQERKRRARRPVSSKETERQNSPKKKETNWSVVRPLKHEKTNSTETKSEQSIKTTKTTRMSKYVETLEPEEADKKKKEKKNMATLLSESLTVVELPSKMIQALDSQRDAKRSPEFAQERKRRARRPVSSKETERRQSLEKNVLKSHISDDLVRLRVMQD